MNRLRLLLAFVPLLLFIAAVAVLMPEAWNAASNDVLSDRGKWALASGTGLGMAFFCRIAERMDFQRCVAVFACTAFAVLTGMLLI